MAEGCEIPKAKRRRSLGFLKALSVPTTQDGTTADNADKRKSRPLSSLYIRTPKDDVPAEELRGQSASPKPRPRTLLKGGRPSSIFGSLRSSTQSSEEKERLTPSSAVSSADPGTPVPFSRVLLHGDVHISGGVFGKKKEYLVLTDTHLVRFKNRTRAQEIYPSIPGSVSRNTPMRHMSTASVTSLHEAQTVASVSSTETKQGIQLNQIISISRLDDGRPTFSLEIAHLEDEINHASSMIIQISDPKEADLWLSSVRGAAQKARLTDPSPYAQMTIDHITKRLDLERDYDPRQFKLFKVVQRILGRTMSRQSDDPSKATSSVKYLVIGIHKVHMITLQEAIRRTPSNSAPGPAQQVSYGLMTLNAISVRGSDDVFELRFRMPLNAPTILSLASVSSTDIITHLRQMMEYLRPNWVHTPYNFSGPKHLREEPPSLPSEPGEYDHLDRTLVAYCAAYALDTSAIRYAIDVDVEDGPLVTLLPPDDPTRADYSLLELLAFFRSLRFNQAFRSVSFHGMNLDVLRECKDFRGTEHVPFLTRGGQPLKLINHEGMSLLIQEIQGLAVGNPKLRRMNFSFCIGRRPANDDVDESGNIIDPGCEICEAIFPLCRRGLTNVDWITLNGIELSETDLDYLVDAAVERACHFRALEISSCNLTDRSLQLILNAMLSQDATLESIDLSNNLARLSPATFQGQIGHFGLIRKLNLSRVQRTHGPEPLVAPETLLTWRLEELHLSQTLLNRQTVDSISAYLASDMSDTLRELHLNQCGLTGNDLAVFMHSMTRTAGTARNLHLLVSENRLEKDHDKFVDAVAKNMTPTHLTMKMVEYHKEDHFRELIAALQQNTTLRYLDISKASLPYDANDDTCEALQRMFAQNTTLQILDISGEHAHLETAKFGIGLNHALMGLVHNTNLQVLRIEYQKLGLQGASTLSTVLESNSTLKEIYCEHNDINLQGLTVLVNALQRNRTVTFLPSMYEERHRALGMIKREVEGLRQDLRTIPANRATSTIRKGFTAIKNNAAPKLTTLERPSSSRTITDQDQIETLRVVDEKWEKQVQRLERYLMRNFNLANGLMSNPEIVLSGFATDDEDEEEEEAEGTNTKRPPTATGFGHVIQKIKSAATTPQEEKSEISFLGGMMVDKLSLSKVNEGKDKENNK